jgi:hypothetical protein
VRLRRRECDEIADVDSESQRYSTIRQSIGNPQSAINNLMRLYVGPMNAVVVEVSPDGRVRLEGEDWSTPTLQERRAIIYAAQQELAALTELLEVFQGS